MDATTYARPAASTAWLIAMQDCRAYARLLNHDVAASLPQAVAMRWVGPR